MPTDDQVNAFITRWSASAGSERGNHQLFVAELCRLLEVPAPDPVHDDGDNPYVFERQVSVPDDEGAQRTGWIDCYRRGCFVLEAKQATAKGTLRRGTPAHQTRLLKAKQQAAGYVRALDPASEPAVPFLIVLDVGGSFDLYADFTRTNRYWTAFPDAATGRIQLADLVRPEIRARLRQVWLTPYALDPAAKSQVVTQEAAHRLAGIARQLEAAGHTSERVAGFLMRFFFCAFAEDVGLMRPRQFTEFLIGYRGKAEHLQRGLEALWGDLDRGGFSTALRAEVLHFNGGLFAESHALPISEEQLLALIATAELDWSPVEPAIFGTLLERALDPKERHRLGAHYTPRAHVDLLVSATLVEPLRAEWQQVQELADVLCADELSAKAREARFRQALTLIKRFSRTTKEATIARNQSDPLAVAGRLVEVFHRYLAGIRVLDPACGSGNFLYVALEHLKRLEGEVLALEARLGLGGSRIALAKLDVDPRNFLGLELNPRAARIAELVLWIGYLQWYRRAGGGAERWPDPVLHAYHNIVCQDALIAHAGVRDTGDTRWDGTTIAHPVTGQAVPDQRAREPVVAYDQPAAANWPEADFIVGNPPFIGNKRLRQALGDGYVEAVRAAWPAVPETADFVMYWWHHAAVLVRAGRARRFGFITTNSITQTHQRDVTQPHLDEGLHIAWAIADHPWVDSADGAAVRVAMTVGSAESGPGRLVRIEGEEDAARLRYTVQAGDIHADLTIGARVAAAVPLRANAGLSFMGVTLVGDGFRLTAAELAEFGLDPGDLPPCVRPYLNGRDVSQGGEPRWVIDFFGLDDAAARTAYPALYQRIADRVRPERAENKRAAYRDRWWLFGEPRQAMRRALIKPTRFIITLETAKHRFFVFAPRELCPDHSLFVVASDDALTLGVLSSRIHEVWSIHAGSTLEDRPRWRNNTCFEPFPFPLCTAAQSARIRTLSEELDAHRARQQAAHPGLTLTGMYNVLVKLRSGEALTAKERAIHEQGLCSVLRDLHDRLDVAVAEAYGWPADLSEADILTRLVALNAERATEERRGRIRWLRPDLQSPAPPAVASGTPAGSTLPDTRGRRQEHPRRR